MVIESAFVLLPALLMAITLKLNVPSAVGMPDIIPSDDNDNPVGKVPLLDHVGAVPVAVSVWLYAVPTVPFGKSVVVIIGATALVDMAIDNAFVSFPALFVALTVKLDVPAAVGVPDIMPLEESVSPFGKLPLDTVHVIGVVPVAASV